ncbi:nephrin [Alosa pseudoharengus]|uniref:nephrin n=1 Tax=Alosa pseudoharengus TaxID=34774 RepID=UPI003F8A9747
MDDETALEEEPDICADLCVICQCGVKSIQAQQAFLTQPRNVTVQAGAKAQLNCHVLRATGLVQWVKDGLLLGPQRNLPGFPRYSIFGDERRGEYHLLIEDVALEDDAPYECQVGQSESSPAIISQTAWLNVQVPPLKLQIELESSETWVAGKEYSVKCMATDAKPAAEITLFKDGIQLTDLDIDTMPGSEDKLMNTEAEVRYVSLEMALRMRLKVAASTGSDPNLMEVSAVEASQQPQAKASWAESVEEDDPLSPDITLRELFPIVCAGEVTEEGDEEGDDDSVSELLTASALLGGSDEEDNVLPLTQRPRLANSGSGGGDTGKVPEVDTLEKKATLPTVPSWLKVLKDQRVTPFFTNVSARSFHGNDVERMEEDGLYNPPASVAYHLNPKQRGVLTTSKPNLPGRMEWFTAAIHQNSYRLQPRGDATPELFEEIVVVNDLILRSVRGGVQGCGRVMALSVTGERGLWLNLSSLSEKDKAELMDATVDPKGLFGEAVGQMQKRSEDKKKEGEAFNLARKFVPQPRQVNRFPAAQTNRPAAMGFRRPKPQPRQQEAPRPGPSHAGAKPWGKQSFAAAAAATAKEPQPPAAEGKLTFLWLRRRRAVHLFPSNEGGKTAQQCLVKAEGADHGGQLVCQAMNSALTAAMSDTKLMTIYFPPQAPVIEGLESTTVKAGTTLKLVCLSHGGNPLASLQWTKNGKLLSSSWEEDVVQRRSRSLLILMVTAEDNQAILQCESINQVSRAPLYISHILTVYFEPAKVNLLGTFEAIEGKTVTLCCHASSSNPPVQIRWWLGFKELNTTVRSMSKGENGGMMTMSNLTYTVSREENGLPLSCEAFNKGTHFSSSTSKPLNVLYPPQKVWLDAPPEDVTLQSGHPLRLLCFSSGGNPRGQLTWFKNGEAKQDTSNQVSLERGVARELRFILQPSDNLATFRCDATNKAKKVLSVKTRLKVQFAAIKVEIKVVVQEKTPQVLRRGETVSLICLCGSSNPKANITWTVGSNRLSGVETDSKEAEYGGVSFRSTLSFSLTSQHHQQRVTCNAFSKLLSGGVSSSYTLNVLFPPEFSSDQPKEVKAVENDEVSLPLMVSANPKEITCDWIYHGRKLDKETDFRYSWDDDFVLKIKNVTRHDAGVYAIECSNDEGQNHTQIYLHISYAPRIRMKSNIVYVDIGGTIDLLCEVEANPVSAGMFSWSWLGDGEIDLESQHEDGTTGWLTLFEVTRAHTGTYQCNVDNGISPPAVAEVKLIVYFKPHLKKGPQWNKVASRGDGVSTVDIACQAEGIPKVHFNWAKNGMAMDFSNPRYMEHTVRVGAVHTSTLSIENVSATEDYAIFTCTASNNLGEDSLDIQLLSTNHPEPPSNLRLLHVSNNSVTLEWKPGFDGGLTQKFRIRYHWKGFSSYHYVDVFPPKATVYTVTGLLPATTYNFSVNAVNNMGESNYADGNTVLTVTTRGQYESMFSFVKTHSF